MANDYLTITYIAIFLPGILGLLLVCVGIVLHRRWAGLADSNAIALFGGCALLLAASCFWCGFTLAWVIMLMRARDRGMPLAPLLLPGWIVFSCTVFFVVGVLLVLHALGNDFRNVKKGIS